MIKGLGSRGLKNCPIFMATSKVRTSSFSKNFSAAPTSSVPGLKYGPNGTIFLSSGIPDLDSNPNTPFLYFIKASKQGLVHNQPVLYASPVKNPRAFLGTLPTTLVPKDDKSRNTDAEQKDLQIAWQYKKYLGENKQHNEERGNFVSFYPLWGFLMGNRVECFSLLDCSNLAGFRDSCSKFISQFPKYDGNITSAGRIAIQSF
uniref:Uncharacterized protein n=1 Tax=Lactuca sativa TaxID=4236 RepID=A0A9R1VUZ7_LACSA|nr:hypothetical protein LSAT_V11C400183610 [Lactuca sativa]